MKKRLLASFLAMVMVVTLLPISALATGGTPATMTGTADNPITNTNNGVTVNKYVSGNETDGYKLTLEAYASDEQTTTTTTTPLDIVLVLDTSGSMGDKWEGAHFEAIENKTEWSFNDVENHDGTLYCMINGHYYEVKGDYNWWDQSDYKLQYHAGFLDWRDLTNKSNDPNAVLYTGELYQWVGGTSKLNAMQNAVNNFIDSVKTNSLEDQEVCHQIGIVEFASNGYIEAGLTNVETGADSLKTTVNNFVASGATAVDYALDKASNVLSSARSDAKKVIVLFTDGEPNHGNGFDRQVAADAINEAQRLKTSGVTIYTIGVFADARPDDTTGDFNKYMNAVSSRYPQATAKGSNDYHNRRLTVTWGEDAGKQYYFAADNAASLNQVFSDIADEVTTNTLTANPGADSVLSDTLSGYFAFPAGLTGTSEKIQVQYAPAKHYDPETKTFDFGEPGDLPDGVTPTVTVEDGTITVTGFDYKTYAATYDSAKDSVSGGKLVVTFPIVANQSCTAWQAGVHNYDTNADTSLTYKMKEGPDGSTNLVDPSNPEKVASPTVPVTAYTVTYDSNGVTGTVTDNQAYISGQTATVKAAPEYEDHTFGGWKTGDTTYEANETFVVTGDVILTAQWTEDVDPTPDPDWDVSRSKTAENLETQSDGSYTSDVTLSLPSAEETLTSDVVFVLDKSSCEADVTTAALDMLGELYTSASSNNATIKVGAVQFAGQATVSCELTELTQKAIGKDGVIYQGLKERKIQDGTNLQAGLLKAQEMLAADNTVDNNRKYVIVITDGLTRQFLSESGTLMTIYNAYSSDDQRVGGDPTAWSIANGFGDGEYKIPGGNWDTYFTAVKNNVVKDGDTYAHEMNWIPVAGEYVPAGGSLDHALCLDRAIYEADKVYQELKQSGYQCFAVFTGTPNTTSNQLGEAFVKYLNNGKTLNFDDIHDDIYYLLSAGSEVVDVIGDDFDFVNNANNLNLKVGNTTLTATSIAAQDGATATYAFGAANGSKDGNDYPYVVSYYQNGKDGSGECFVWEINVDVSNFAPVQLTYTVELTSPSTEPGTYGQYDADGSKDCEGLYTNESAILYPVDSNGLPGKQQEFAKPTVSYTVGGYDLTYDANGGNDNSVPTDTHTYKAEDVAPLDTETVPTHPNAKVNPDDTVEVPVKFIGWSLTDNHEAIYEAGEDYGTTVDKVTFEDQDITVYAVWGYDTNDDGIADATQVMIKPANITIYMGGTGYGGAVDENGTIVANNGFPEAGFVLTVPASIKNSFDISRLTLQYKGNTDDPNAAESQNYSWGFQFYGKGNSEVYRIVPIGDTATRTVRMQFTKMVDGVETVVDDDQFTFEDYLDETLTMKVYGEGIEEDKVSFLYDSQEYSIGIRNGELTVRGTTISADYGELDQPITAENPGLTAPDDTTYFINGGNVQVDNDSVNDIALLFDNIIESDSSDPDKNKQLLEDRTDRKLKELGIQDSANRKYEFKYLDLVDTGNGNAWVSSSKPVTVYWPLPEGTTKNTTFTLLHFEGMHREMGSDYIGTAVDAAKVTKVTIKEVTDTHIVFETQGFSPFALVYDAATVDLTYEPNGGSGTAQKTTYDKGTEVTLAGSSLFTNSGYNFTGWNTKADGSGTPYAAGATITLNSDVTLYAQWERKPEVIVNYYTLHYESNGGTKYEDERYPEGHPVTLDKVPLREGYTFTGWYADEALTKPIDRIVMNGNKTVYAGWRKTTVPDGLNGDDHFAYVIGYDDGTVKPLANIARSEVAAIFFRLLDPEVREEYLTDANPFTDVNPDDWYSKAVSTLYQLDIFKGRTATTFAPDAPITRAEFAVICARFDTGTYDGNANFNDIQGHWAEKEIKRAASLGWIMGAPDGNFYPNQLITRAEAMTMINRVLNRIPEDESDLLNGMNVWPDNPTNAWYYLAVQEATNTHDYVTKGEIYETWTKLLEDPDWTQYQ